MTVRPDHSAIELTRGVILLEVEHDISGARRRLQHAAELGSAEAARLLAQTYDPVWLASHDVMPWSSIMNPELAFQWYKKAAELGDRDPRNRYLQAKQD